MRYSSHVNSVGVINSQSSFAGATETETKIYLYQIANRKEVESQEMHCASDTKTSPSFLSILSFDFESMRVKVKVVYSTSFILFLTQSHVHNNVHKAKQKTQFRRVVSP